MEDEIKIVPMLPEHIEAVAYLDSLAHGDDKWTADMFSHELKQGYTHYLCAFCGDTLVGAAGSWNLLGESDIATIAVHPDWQGRGIGTLLFAKIVQAAVDDGIEAATLEVRCDNWPALAVYEKFGFKKLRLRRHYYANGEDAYLMRSEGWQTPEFSALTDEILNSWKLKNKERKD